MLGEVSALAANSNTLYVGGSFSSIAGILRKNLAAIDLGSGSITIWNYQICSQALQETTKKTMARFF